MTVGIGVDEIVGKGVLVDKGVGDEVSVDKTSGVGVGPNNEVIISSGELWAETR